MMMTSSLPTLMSLPLPLPSPPPLLLLPWEPPSPECQQFSQIQE
jgi:hypothetical protein